MRNVSDRNCRENENTHFVSNFLNENCAVYEIIWKYFVDPGRPQMTVWLMRIARWVTKATDTHSEYVILIAFPRQRWLYERELLLGYTSLSEK
jgi:hypothetical protein